MDPKLHQALLETFKGELTDQHESLVNALLSLETVNSKKEITETIGMLFRISHNLKGAAKSVAIDDVANLAHKLEDLFDKWSKSKHTPSKEEVNLCLGLADNMLSAFNASQDRFFNKQHQGDELLKIPSYRIETINSKLEDLMLAQLQLEHLSLHALSLLNALKSLKNDDSKWQHVQSGMKKLSDKSKQLSSSFARDLSTLKNETRKMRLMPLNHVLTPLKQTVRTLADDLGKNIALVVEGEDIEVDKAILDALKTPLQHIVRNAASHGIETANERKRLGKRLTATIAIRAQSDISDLTLVISDDGQGIDIKKLKEKALEKKLYAEDVLKGMNNQAAIDLIFHSGLSTADTVSELSGRGVGMEAVKNDIQQVKGSIQVTSRSGKGTTFTLQLPMQLSSVRGLFFSANEIKFILPTSSLHALHNVALNSLTVVNNQLSIILKDTPIPAFYLSELLNIKQTELSLEKEYQGIILQQEDKQIMLLVDTIEEERLCVLKPLPSPLDQLKPFAGATLLENGQLVLALKKEYLLYEASHSTQTHRHELGPERTQQKPLEHRRVLVVDDALTTRTLAMNALTAAGYEAVSANDGLEAWDTLQHDDFDCVITDIEMPGLNGIELTKRIRDYKPIAKIPIIIISSANNQEYKKRGAAAGANAYLVKNDFETSILLNTLDKLL